MSLTIHEIASRLGYYLGLYPVGRDKSPSADKAPKNILPWFASFQRYPFNTEQPIQSNFAARFLPAFIAAYKSAPAPGGLYSKVMVPITGTAYLGKFLRNTLGYDLEVFHAELMVKADIFSLNPHEIMNLIVILFHLMLYRNRKVTRLSEDTRRQVGKWLERAGDDAMDQLRLHSSQVKDLSPSDVGCYECSFLPQWGKEPQGNTEDMCTTFTPEDVRCILSPSAKPLVA
ncbi:hypothetical protein C8R46DRAFT_1044824 [Mycena filopes]|nr:hypothetical protein C8R46DRAFT_1044824 [Mycena filopes]